MYTIVHSTQTCTQMYTHTHAYTCMHTHANTYTYMYFRVWCLAHCRWRVVHRCSSGCRSETSMQSRRFARTPYWEVISARVGYSNMLPSKLVVWLTELLVHNLKRCNSLSLCLSTQQQTRPCPTGCVGQDVAPVARLNIGFYCSSLLLPVLPERRYFEYLWFQNTHLFAGLYNKDLHVLCLDRNI